MTTAVEKCKQPKPSSPPFLHEETHAHAPRACVCMEEKSMEEKDGGARKAGPAGPWQRGPKPTETSTGSNRAGHAIAVVRWDEHTLMCAAEVGAEISGSSVRDPRLGGAVTSVLE